MSHTVATHVHASARIELRNALLELAHRLARLAKQQEEGLQVVGKEEEGEEGISPIQQAPADILHHIFAFCLSDNELTIDDPNHPAVILSHVCKSWRELVIGHSTYWSNIRILTPTTPISDESPEAGELKYQDAMLLWAAKMQRIYNAARAFITRSDECPVTITFNKEKCVCPLHVYEDYDLYSDTYASLLQLLCSSSRRWTRCGFNVPSCGCVYMTLGTVFNLKRKDVPMLSHLEWKARDAMPSRTLEDGGIFRAPTLRTLHLLPNMCSRPWNWVSSNWSTLTELHYNGFTWRSFSREKTPPQYFGPRSALALLKRCPALVTCSLEMLKEDGVFSSQSTHQDYPEEDLESSIELSHLRSFTLRTDFPTRELVDTLRLPSLRDLHLPHGTSSSPENLWPWMRRESGQSLTSLTLVLGDHDPEEIPKLLQCVPGLRSLETRFTEKCLHGDKLVAIALLDCLSGQIDSDSGEFVRMCVCPRLRRFGCFQHYFNVTFSERDIVRFVKARRPPVLGRHGVGLIEDVEVEFARPPGRVDIRGLLVEEGVDVEGLGLKVIYERPWRKGYVYDSDEDEEEEEEEEDALDDNDED